MFRNCLKSSFSTQYDLWLPIYRLYCISVLHINQSTSLSPKSNLGFICECIWVKPSSKSIITTKEALLRFTMVSFSGKHIFSGVQGHFYTSIKIALFKTLRRLDTTWNFARSITRVSTHEHKHWEHCLCTQSLLKRVFGQLTFCHDSGVKVPLHYNENKLARKQNYSKS